MKKRNGFLLVGVLLIFVFMLIIVPVMVRWVQDDTKISVKDQKSTLAFNLAEAAVDRGYWKVKSSTGIYASVTLGNIITGYHFDSVYTDVPGGSYRVNISSGPDMDQVTILGEGRDSDSKEKRTIKAVFTNTSVPGAILSAGQLNANDIDSTIHWGPIMAKGDIVLATGYPNYPRKLSMQTVKPRDPTGDTNPPNTDSLEWWSNYNVPDLPIFDFAAMRSSAAQTGTLDCQDAYPETYTNIYNPCTGSACTDPGANCSCTNTTTGPACVDSGANCSCATKVCSGSGCTDPGSGCSCTGSGASKVCTGNSCPDPGANCDCSVTCTGSGCTDSDGSGSGCIQNNNCTGTGCADSDGAGAGCACTVTVTTTTATTAVMQCCHSTTYGGPITCDYDNNGDTIADYCTNCTLTDIFHQTTYRDKDYTWYWDQNATWGGYTGVKGTIVTMGNMTIDTVGHDDRYCRSDDTTNTLPASPGCVVAVPPNAWREYQKFDTAASNEYPGDTGLRSNALTYRLGSLAGAMDASGSGGDLGVYGFLYIGGNFTRGGASDIYGSMWVVGNVSGTGNTMVFYNSKLHGPTLNVVLTKDSWQEQ